MTCKGICIRHKAPRPTSIGRYAAGQGRCQVCEIFIKWNGLWCPCCGFRLRKNPRKTVDKVKLRQSEKVKELGPKPTLNVEVTLWTTWNLNYNILHTSKMRNISVGSNLERIIIIFKIMLIEQELIWMIMSLWRAKSSLDKQCEYCKIYFMAKEVYFP
jgi:hypothetical protein